ncbi:hypothetical protein [Lutibacter maritimus]|uniref:Minor capsid protein n=1 Tax=Lutibacter maritimus TaxID=593133 RepID=A0A1I6NS01_9FLAO|nr:hypothetical protein [Lutibacter maritimus]SFS30792.1 hypothetical protein SAMN04488006_0486 [Lutibacter maritimus]
MKSSLQILSALYKLINVDVVNNIISGEVFIGDEPDGNQDENITLNTLTNPNEYLQSGYANVNVHIKEVKSGRPNLEKFNEIIAVLIPLLEDSMSDNVYFQIDDDKGIFKDVEKDSMYFYNLKLKFQTL